MALLRDEPLTSAMLRRQRIDVIAIVSACGVGESTLDRWLSGIAPAPWVQREIARALRVEPTELWPAEEPVKRYGRRRREEREERVERPPRRGGRRRSPMRGQCWDNRL